MNRTIRNLVIAVPLATVGLTMVNVAAATADPIDPNFPIAIPDEPKGPGDKAPLPQPKPPQDKAPLPQPKPEDKAPKPQAQPQGGNQTVAVPTVDTQKADTAVEVVSAHGSADSIDRTDALFAGGPAETELTATTDDGGLDLTWLLLGGGVVTASGIAFAARKRQQNA
ncbi:hypothetical protein GCM10022234_19700 [Aeromicrobium panaciterrae]|uniref:hypothetical protein n=1 Tax=Aeromicrobium panaciterrae TaxID=363861 RepID=UPI0031CE5723